MGWGLGENIFGKAEQKQCQGCHHYQNTTASGHGQSHGKLCRKDGEREERGCQKPYSAKTPTVPKLGDLVQNRLLSAGQVTLAKAWQLPVAPRTWGVKGLILAAEPNLWHLYPVKIFVLYLLPPYFHRWSKSLPLTQEQEAFTVFERANPQMILFLISLMSLLALTWWQVNEFALSLTSSYGNDLKPFVTMHQKYKVIKNSCPTMKLVID